MDVLNGVFRSSTQRFLKAFEKKNGPKMATQHGGVKRIQTRDLTLFSASAGSDS
jgi:hypothetical protein